MANLSIEGFIERLRFPVRYPPVAIDIDARSVAVVRVKREKGRGRLLGYGIAPLSEEAAPPSVSAPRISGAEELKTAMARALQAAGIRSGKASLVVPDTTARIWVLQLPEIPRKPQALLEIVRWKIKRSLPFKVEEGDIVYQVLSRPSGAVQGSVLVGLMPRSIVAAYESFAAAAGVKIGLVDVASFNLFNFYRRAVGANGSASRDLALLNATESYFTLMLFMRGELIFYRCKVHPDPLGESPEERVRTLRRELSTSLSYYSEKLSGKGILATYVRMTDPSIPSPVEAFEGIGLGEVKPVNPPLVADLPAEVSRETALRLIPAMGAALGRLA